MLFSSILFLLYFLPATLAIYYLVPRKNIEARNLVLLAASLCQRAHLYLWDEPLNYLDIDCRRQIETLIREFAPTMVFVEHDGAFREAVATRTVKVERG